jgi:hypothetical protein
MRVLTVLLLAGLCLPAHAGVYRCKQRLSGAIRYQNEPCPGGSFQWTLRTATPAPPELFDVPRAVEILPRTPVRVVPPVDERKAALHP